MNKFIYSTALILFLTANSAISGEIKKEEKEVPAVATEKVENNKAAIQEQAKEKEEEKATELGENVSVPKGVEIPSSGVDVYGKGEGKSKENSRPKESGKVKIIN